MIISIKDCLCILIRRHFLHPHFKIRSTIPLHSGFHELDQKMVKISRKLGYQETKGKNENSINGFLS